MTNAPREVINIRRQHRAIIKQALRERATWNLQVTYQGRTLVVEPIRFIKQQLLVVRLDGKLTLLTTTLCTEVQLTRKPGAL
jgi:hypothetical protein